MFNLSNRRKAFRGIDELGGAVFNGIDATLSTPDTAVLDFASAVDFSAGMWFKTSASGFQPLMVKGKSTSAFQQFNIRIINGSASAYIRSTTTTEVGVDSVLSTYADNNWHFIMCTFDRDGDVTVYIDAESGVSASIAGIGGNISNTEPLYFGRSEDGNTLFTGTTILGKVWRNRIITSGERITLYNGGTPICTDDLTVPQKVDLVYAPDLYGSTPLLDRSISGLTTTNSNVVFTGSGITVDCT